MRKQFYLIVLIALFTTAIHNLTFAQNDHGIKLGANFASIKTDVDYGSEISSLIGPIIAYEFRSLGDNWGYFMDLGYSQSGLKEEINSNQSSLKVHNMDWIPIGVQYSFFSDWRKFRPILQASLGGRISIYGEAVTQYGTDDSFLDKTFDILWSVGGGVTAGKHTMLSFNYGGGFLTAISSQTNWKNKQFQIAFTYFF